MLPSPPLVDSALKLKPESNSEEGFFVIIFKLPACDAAPREPRLSGPGIDPAYALRNDSMDGAVRQEFHLSITRSGIYSGYFT